MSIQAQVSAVRADVPPLPSGAVTFDVALADEAYGDWEYDVRFNDERLTFGDYFLDWCRNRHITELMASAPPPDLELVSSKATF